MNKFIIKGLIVMQDKSIRDTAIITFTLIGGLFLLQKCSNNEVRKIALIEQNQTVNRQQTLIDSYEYRDNEILLASYKTALNIGDDKIDKTHNLRHSVVVEKNGSQTPTTIKIIVSRNEINSSKDQNKT